MTTSLNDLIRVPTAEELKAQMLRELQGVSFTYHSGFSTGTVTLSGVPVVAYAVRVKITTAGELGTAAFRYSTDGGNTYSSVDTVPVGGSYPIPATPLAIVFANGPAGTTASFVVDDVFSVDTRVPTFPATSWQPFSVPLSLVENDAAVSQDVYRLVSLIVAGGFTSTAAGPWLDLVAEQFFDLTRNPAVATQGYAVLTDAGGAGPFTISNNEIWALSASGLRFNSVGAYTLPASGTVTILLKAESPGASYNVGNNTIQKLVTALPGVTINNPDPGSGSWITVQGANTESDQDLARRCRARWGSLGIGSPDAAYELWARTASASVTKTLARVSTTVAGHVELYIAGTGGGVGPSVVTDVDNYVQPRLPLCVTAEVQSATNEPITVEATVYVRAGYQAQAAIDCAANLTALFNDIPIGGTVYLSAIVEALMTPAGVRNVSVVDPVADVVLGDTDVATLTQDLSFVVV